MLNKDMLSYICVMLCCFISKDDAQQILSRWVWLQGMSWRGFLKYLCLQLCLPVSIHTYTLCGQIWHSKWLHGYIQFEYIYTYILMYVNYVNPVCCVATACHQVRCMYWGHLGHFHRAISHLKWYKIVCMRYLACTFSQMKSINTFSMCLQSGVPRHFVWRFIAVWIYNLTVFMFMYVNVDLKL